MAGLPQVDTGQRVVKAEEKFKHRKGGWCWEARGNLDLHGIREAFLEEVLFELGLGVRGIWMPSGEQGSFPEQSTGAEAGREVEVWYLRAGGAGKVLFLLFVIPPSP